MPARKVKKQRSSDPIHNEEEEVEREEEMTQAWSVLAVSVLKERSPRIISLLVEQGAFLDFTNAKGYTPLHTGSSFEPRLLLLLILLLYGLLIMLLLLLLLFMIKN
jgi:hypothetical protein